MSKSVITGKYKYKCRLCGEVFNDSSTSTFSFMRLNMQALIMGASLPIDVGVSPSLMELHYCKSGEVGIADMIGLVKDKTN